MNFNILHAKIISAVLENPYGVDECERYRFEDDEGNNYHQAVVKLADGVSIIFTLPTKARHIFLLAGDGDVGLLRRVLANIE